MTYHMLNSSSRKAQFFVLTAVMIIGIFYTLSKYINPYAFIDTSGAAEGSEEFFFDNVKEKAIRTVEIANSTKLNETLETYKNFVEKLASDKGYNLVFYYDVNQTHVNINMVLMSQRKTLRSSFSIPKPSS